MLLISRPFYNNIAESNVDARGVVREVWGDYTVGDAADFQEVNEIMVDYAHVIQTLDAPKNFDYFYVQKLTTYFQVKWRGKQLYYSVGSC